MKADLVLFDPATVIDRSTFEQPQLGPRGIHAVFVNGVAVWGRDRDGPMPGQVIRSRRSRLN